MRHTKYKPSIVGIKLGVVYQIKLLKKIYIGITMQKLENRIRSHCREALVGAKYKGESLPFISPYENFKGKNSAIKRLFTTSKLHKEIRYLDSRKKNKHLFKLVMSRVTILRRVRCKAVFNEKLKKCEVDRSYLEAVENRYIEKLWIDNPKQLLNYNKIPFLQRYSYLLKDTLEKELEKLKETNKSSDDVLINIIKANRRSCYRRQLAIINKEIKALNSTSSYDREEALDAYKKKEQEEQMF